MIPIIAIGCEKINETILKIFILYWKYEISDD